MAGEKEADETTDKPTHKGQGRLPGMTPKRIAVLSDKAEEVLEQQEKRMSAAEKENKARLELKALMKAEGLKKYQLDDDYEVVIEASEETAYIRKIKRAKAKKSKKSDD